MQVHVLYTPCIAPNTLYITLQYIRKCRSLKSQAKKQYWWSHKIWICISKNFEWWLQENFCGETFYGLCWHLYNRGTAKFGRDRNRSSEIADVSIPYSNCSQSNKDSWFVSYSTLVPTKNAKSSTPLFRGTAKFGRDRDRRSKMLPFHTPTLVEVLRIVGLSFIPLLCLQKMRNRWHLYSGGTAKFGRDRNRCIQMAPAHKV